MDDTADCVVPLRGVLVPCTTVSPLRCNKDALDILGVVDPTRTSDVHSFVGVVGGTRMFSTEELIRSLAWGLIQFGSFQRGSLRCLTLWQGFGSLPWVWWLPFR